MTRLNKWNIVIILVFYILAFSLLGLVTNGADASTASHCSKIKKYDQYFKKYSNIYLPMNNWQLLKAQGCQESLLNNDVVSPVGASTIMQFMPGTAGDMIVRFGWNKQEKFTARQSIKAGAFYLSSLRKSWRSKRPQSVRTRLALASYNWGFGNVLKAQRKANGSNMYEPLVQYFPKETAEYVPRIYAIYSEFILWDFKNGLKH